MEGRLGYPLIVFTMSEPTVNHVAIQQKADFA